jgi:hypothetical protein
MKYVFPALWIGLFGLGTCGLWLGAFHGRNGDPPLEWMKWLFLVAWLVGTGFILWSCGRLKRVQVDDEALYVSNYWSEVRVPFTEVSHFAQSFLSRPPTVTVHLRSVSPVGERVVFIPKFRWVVFGTHPIISELQALCDRANTQSGVDRTKVEVVASNRGSMRVLQVFCAFLCLLSVLSAVTGIQSISVADRVVIAKHGGFGRIYSLFVAGVFAAAVYGIRRRAPIVWKLGWVLLAASFVSFVVSALPGALRQPPPGCWIVAAFILIGGLVVTVYWGWWWKRQRDYFRPEDEADRSSAEWT